jgi:hypothetical protein
LDKLEKEINEAKKTLDASEAEMISERFQTLRELLTTGYAPESLLPKPKKNWWVKVSEFFSRKVSENFTQ